MANKTAQQPEQIALSGIETRDITKGAIDSLHFTQEELALFLASNGGNGASFSDIESTGLGARSHGVTQFSSAKAVAGEKSGAAKMELLDVYMLPTKPIFHEYQLAAKWAEENGNPPPSYNRRLYEYDVDEAALRVTGTKYHRARDDGPITGMQIEVKDDAGTLTKVKSIANPCESFYRAIPKIEEFIVKDHDLYYNAPFDKPFLREKWLDALAYQRYVEQHPDEERRAEALYTNPEAVASDIATLRGELEKEAETSAALAFLGNSNQWQCLLHGYMAARPSQPSNTLDTSFTDLVDTQFEGRKEHDAAEDIAMSAKVAAKLMGKDHFNGDIPTFAQLYKRVIQRTIPDAQVEADAPYNMPYYVDNDVKKRLDSDYGHLRITIPLDEKGELDDRAAALHDFFADFDETYRRNTGSPQHIVEMAEVNGAVEILVNTNRSKPLSINLLKKLLFFEDAMQMKERVEEASPEMHIENINWFDSTAKVDVQLDKSSKLIEDVPLRSLQINLKFLRDHCSDAAERGEYLELIKQVTQRKAASQLYLSYDEKTQQTHLQIKGNLRGGGVIDIAIPKDEHPLDYSFDVMQQLDRLLKMGALFGVEASQRSFEEEEELESYDLRGRKEADNMSFGTSVALEGRKGENGVMLPSPPFSLNLSPALGQMIWNRYRHDDPSNDTPIAIGDEAQLIRDADGRVQFMGELDEAFARHPLDIEKAGATKKTAEFSRVLADCSWLAYRLQDIPGVSDLTIHPDHRGALIFPNGISTKALMVLHEARVPFSISPSDNHSAPTRITLNMDALMVDAFEYSRDLSRATKDIKAFFSGDPEKLRAMNKEKQQKYSRYETDISRISAALYAGDIAALEMNMKGEMRFSTKRDMADAAQHNTPPLRHKFQNLGQDHQGNRQGLRIATDGAALKIDKSTIKAPMDVPLNVRLDTEKHQALVTLRSPMAEWMQAMMQGVEGVKAEDKTAPNATIAKRAFTLDTRQEPHNQLLTKLSALSECYYYLSMIHSQPRFSFTKQKMVVDAAGKSIASLMSADGDMPSLTLTPYGANLSGKAAGLYAKLDQIRTQLDEKKDGLDEVIVNMHRLLRPDTRQGHDRFDSSMRRSLPSAKALDALMTMPIENRFDVMDQLTQRCDEVKDALKEYRHLCISFTDEIEKLRGELQDMPEAQRAQHDVVAKLTALNGMHDDVQRMHNAMERMEDAASTLKAQCYDKQRTNGLARRFIDLELAHLSETLAARIESVLQSDSKDEDAAIKKSLHQWREMMIEKITHAATDSEYKITGKGENARRENDEDRADRRTKRANDILDQAVLREVVALIASEGAAIGNTSLTYKDIASDILKHLIPELTMDAGISQHFVNLCDPESDEEAKSKAEEALLETFDDKKQIRLIEDLISASLLTSKARSESELVQQYQRDEIDTLPKSKNAKTELPKIHRRIKSAMKRVRTIVPDPHGELKAMRALLNKIGNEDEGVIKELNDFERTMLHGARHMNQALAMLYAEPDVLGAAQGEQSAIEAHKVKWSHAHAASDALLEEGKRMAQQNLEALGLVAANDTVPDSFTIDMSEIVKDPEKWSQKLRDVLVKPQQIAHVQEAEEAVQDESVPPDNAQKDAPDTPVQDIPITPEIEAVERGIHETLDYLKEHPELAKLSGMMLSVPLNVPETYREIYQQSAMQLINETTVSLHPEWAGMARCELNEKGELMLHASPAIMPHLLKGLLHHQTALEHLAKSPRTAAPEAPDAGDALLAHEESGYAEILSFPEMNSADAGEPTPQVEAGEHQGLTLSEISDLSRNR